LTGSTKASFLLFVKTQVAERAPRKGSRLAAERKRRLENEPEGSKRQGKKGKWEAGTGTMAEQAERTPGAPHGREDEPEPKS
jgi:hypothetical protein